MGNMMNRIFSSHSLILMILLCLWIGLPAAEAGEYKANSAMLVLKDKAIRMRGTILQISEDGIIFDPNRAGPFYDAPAWFYRYSAISRLVDVDGVVLYDEKSGLTSDPSRLALYRDRISIPEPILKPGAFWLSCGLGPGSSWLLVDFSAHLRHNSRAYIGGLQSAVINTVTNVDCIYIGYGYASYTRLRELHLVAAGALNQRKHNTESYAGLTKSKISPGILLKAELALHFPQVAGVGISWQTRIRKITTPA